MTTTSTTPIAVLLVDDDPNVLEVTYEALNQADYKCTTASSAPQALTALKAKSYDVMVVDVNLPGMSGFEIARRALALQPELAVITMSGQTEIPTPIEAIRVGCLDYLIKPFRLTELVSCVSRVLTKRQDLFNRTRVLRWDAAACALSLSLNARDKETEGHAERVLAYSLRLGREVGLSVEEMIALQFGAQLHDIGKIAVPDSVLKKPHPLTADEWVIMKRHPVIGEQMVLKNDLPAAAAAIVGQHHEKWDGTGYPNGLRGKDIHIGARVFSVVDAYDAITSDRVYRPAQSYDAALTEIQNFSEIQFDPDVVKAFARIARTELEEIRASCPCDLFPEAQMIA